MKPKPKPINLLPYYPLELVKDCLRKGRYQIRPNAAAGALKYFRWREKDIIEALLKLDALMCYKAEPHDTLPGVMVDLYRCEKLHDDENVYTHFYIIYGNETSTYDTLIINSFHNLF